MKKLVATAAALALTVGAAGSWTQRQGGPEAAWETVAGPLGIEADGGIETQVVTNPTYTVSAATYELAKGVAYGKTKVRDIPRDKPTTRKPMKEMKSPVTSAVVAAAADPKLQASVGGKAAPTAGSGFAGLNLQSNGSGWPPDTTGDVGPNYYIQAVNSSIGIYRTSNGSAYWTGTINSFFNAAFNKTGPCVKNNQGDPTVIFDSIAQRWIISDFNWANMNSGPYYECFAISTSSDPTGTWKGFALTADSGKLMNDYPKIASTPNAILMTANLFSGGRSYAGVRVWAIDRDTLFSTSASAVKVLRWDLGTGYFSLLPVNVERSASGGNANTVGGYFVSDYNSTSNMSIWQLGKPNWSAATPTATAPSLVTVPMSGFTRWTARIPQKGSTETVDALGDRLMYQAQYVEDGSSFTILTSRTATAGSYAGIRWSMFTRSNSAAHDAANYTAKVGTYGPSDSTHRWMSSLAVNSKNEVAIGFSKSSSSTFPAVSVAGISNFATGTSVDIAEWSKVGTGSQSGGYSRWGDYSSMTVDPDGCKFWFSTEYYSATGNNWQTWIQPVTLTSCP